MKATCSNIVPLFTHAAPRHHLFTRFTPPTNIIRPLHSSSARTKDLKAETTSSFTQFSRGPAPPRLPKEEQEIFEALQRQSTGAFSTPRSPPKINQSPDSTPIEASQAQIETTSRAEKVAREHSEFNARIQARGDGEELHPNVRRGSQPEFEGEKNPKTGEVGGPKNEPLRWGAAGEWSYNGRTTDF